MITEGQKNIIRASIDFLLDFPNNPDELTQKIACFINAFPLTKQNEGPQKEHEFYALYRFIVYPTQSFPGLEEANADLKISEVQTYIFDYIYEQIKSVLKPKDHTSDLTLYFDTAKSVYVEPNADKKFITVRSRPEQSLLPWERMEERSDAYACSLSIKLDTQEIFLKVKLIIDDLEITHDKIFTHIPSNNGQANFEYYYLCSLIPDAKNVAAYIAKKLILAYCLDQLHFTDIPYQALDINQNANAVITHRYYLKALLEKSLTFNLFTDLTATQAKNLTLPATIELLRIGVLSIPVVTSLTNLQGELLASYLPSLKSKKVSITDLHTVSDEQYKILCLPLIVNQINQGILNFNFVKSHTPPYLRGLLTNHFYMDFLSKKNMPYKNLCTLTFNDCKYLTDKLIINLISNDILHIDTISKVPKYVLETCKIKNINRLLMSEHLTLLQLKNLSLTQIELIEQHPYLHTWVALNIITLKQIDENQLSKMYTSVFSERLFKLLLGNPFKINQIIDSVLTIYEEMRGAAFHIDKTLDELLKETLHDFFLKMAGFLKGYINDKTITKIEKKYCLLLTKLCLASVTKDELYQKNVLAFFNQAETILQAKPHKYRQYLFLAPVSSSGLHILCENIVNLGKPIKNHFKVSKPKPEIWLLGRRIS